MSKDDWLPAWDREGRIPEWATTSGWKGWPSLWGGHKELWGSTPAEDLLKLNQNEGLGFEGDLALLFAGQC